MVVFFTLKVIATATEREKKKDKVLETKKCYCI